MEEALSSENTKHKRLCKEMSLVAEATPGMAVLHHFHRVSVHSRVSATIGVRRTAISSTPKGEPSVSARQSPR